MPTAQDFYNSLIKNPDYQGTLELSREQVVEREALRRMRQHRNNELALSMAAPISAMEKLASYLSKAEGFASEDDDAYMDTNEGEALGKYIQDGLDLLVPDHYFTRRAVSQYEGPFKQIWPNGIHSLFNALNGYIHAPKTEDGQRPWPRSEAGQRAKLQWDASLGAYIDNNPSIDPSKIFHHYMTYLVNEEISRVLEQENPQDDKFETGKKFRDMYDKRSEHLQNIDGEGTDIDLNDSAEFVQPIVEGIQNVIQTQDVADAQERQENQERRQKAKEEGEEKWRKPEPQDDDATVSLSYDRYQGILARIKNMRSVIHPDWHHIGLSDSEKGRVSESIRAENTRLEDLSKQANALLTNIENLAEADTGKAGIKVPRADAEFIAQHFTAPRKMQDGTFQGGNLKDDTKAQFAKHQKDIAFFKKQAVSPDPAAEDSSGAVALSELNKYHMDVHRDTWATEGAPWKMWNPMDWKPEEGTDVPKDELSVSPWGDLLKGWDATYFSAEALKELHEAKFITSTRPATWKWTEEGEKQFKPIVDALHKPWPVNPSSQNMRNKGLVRTAAVHRILDSIVPDDAEGSWAEKHEREPRNEKITFFTKTDIDDEHKAWKGDRETQNESGDTASEEERPGRANPPPPPIDGDDAVEESAEGEIEDHKAFWETGLPHEIDGYFDTEKQEYVSPEILLPKGLDGNYFDPLETLWDEGKPPTKKEAQEMYQKLKDIYIDIHTNKDKLGGDVFPWSPHEDKKNFPFYREYDKENFGDDKIALWNDIHTNKAILEPWLYRFQEYVDPSQKGKTDRWANLWEGMTSWPSAPGLYNYHELLSSIAPQGLQIEPDMEGAAESGGVGDIPRGVKALDHAGNLNFFAIPHNTDIVRGGSYSDSIPHLTNFRGNFELPRTDEVARSILTERYGADWVKNNFGQAYEDYRKTAVPKNKKQSVKAAQAEKQEDIGGLVEWLAADVDGKPRQASYTETTPEGEPSGSEGTSAGSGAADPEPEVEDEVIPDEVNIPDEDEQAEDPFYEGGEPKFNENGHRIDVDGNRIDEDGNIIEEESEEEVSDDGPADDGPGDGVGDDDVDADDDDEQERWRARGAEERAKREGRFPPGPAKESEDVDDTPTTTFDEADARKKDLKDRIFKHEKNIGFGTQEHEDEFQEELEKLELPDLETEWKRVQKERASDRRSDAKTRGKESAKAPEPEGLGSDRRKELIDQYVNAYREMHKQPMNPDWIQVLEGMSDSDLQKKHQNQLGELDKHTQGESKKYRAYTGNNIDSSIPSLAPAAQQKHLTKDDILAQARRLVHHQFAYGDVMEKESKDILTARMAEVRQLAAAANMPLERLMQQDEKEAEESSDYGSTAWLSRVGDAHVQTQTRRNGHKQTVNEQGSQLRANRNYKPHIVATYGDDGNFMGFHDLRANAPIDEFNLGFDEDNHYHFHGLDPEKVKDYLRYKRLTSGETPRKLQTMFGPPSAPDDPNLAALEAKVDGTDYKDVRDRIDMHGNLPGAQELFRKKFGQSRKPVGPDGREENAPRFFMDDRDKVGTNGWYHPESESWINPYRYDYLRNSTEGQPGSGRAIPQGGDYHGRSRRNQRNAPDPRYAFALPTEAKKAKLRTGYGDQSYYIDDTGSIAHAHDSFENGNRQSHEAPQTVNGVVHDWYAQEMGNQIKANPQAFKDEQNNLRDVAEINAPQQSAVQAPPLQNMWLELEAVGGEPGSALERREIKQKSGWNWFDKKIAKPAKAIQHPASRQARSPLTSQQLGQDYQWSGFREAKQKWFDAIDWPQSQIVSWLGRLALPGITSERAEDKVIRRIRQGYKQQARTEQVLRETAGRLTINGQKLSDVYVAPGEQKARTEDYKELDDHIKHQGNYHRIQAKQAKESKDKAAETHHNAEWLRYQAAGNDLKPLQSKMPNHWERINNMYNHHLGKVQQAPPADEALQQWGGEMSQPDQEDWGVRMRQPEQTGTNVPQKPLATMFGGSQDVGQSQMPQKPLQTMFGKSLQKYLRSGYNKVGTL